MSIETLPEYRYQCEKCDGRVTSTHDLIGKMHSLLPFCDGLLRQPQPPEPRSGGPATLAERFAETCESVNHDRTGSDADVAWQLVLDAWRVIEVASARGDVPATCNREEWMAALRVAIFRASYPDAPEVLPEGS